MYNKIIIIMVVDLTKLCEHPNQRFHANLLLTLFLKPQTSMFLRQIPLLDINTNTCGYVHSSSLCPSHSSPYSLCHTHSLSLPPHFVPPATPLTLPRPLTLYHTTFHISPLDCVLVPSPESHSPTLRELSRKNALRSDVKFSPRQHISMLELVAARVILKSQFRDSKYYICRCK